MKKKLLSLLLALAITLSFAGCGASSSYTDSEMMEGAMGEPMEDNGFFLDEMKSDSIAPMTPNIMPNNEESGVQNKTADYLANQKLVYTANLEIESLEFDKSIQEVNKLVEKCNGFVQNNSLSDNSYGWYNENYEKTSGTLTANITLRIPTTKYEEFLSQVSNSGKVMSKSENVENITRRYNETETRIKTLEKEQEMLLDMMDKATNMSDMIVVEERLSDVNQELAVYHNQFNQMQTDIAYSTIHLTINEVVEYTYTPPAQLTFAERISQATEDSFDSFVNVLQGLSILLIFLMPYIIIVLVIVCVIIWIIKKNKKQQTKDKEMTTEDKQNIQKDLNKKDK